MEQIWIKARRQKGAKRGGKDDRARKMRRQREGKVTGYGEKGLCL